MGEQSVYRSEVSLMVVCTTTGPFDPHFLGVGQCAIKFVWLVRQEQSGNPAPGQFDPPLLPIQRVWHSLVSVVHLFYDWPFICRQQSARLPSEKSGLSRRGRHPLMAALTPLSQTATQSLGSSTSPSAAAIPFCTRPAAPPVVVGHPPAALTPFCRVNAAQRTTMATETSEATRLQGLRYSPECVKLCRPTQSTGIRPHHPVHSWMPVLQVSGGARPFLRVAHALQEGGEYGWVGIWKRMGVLQRRSAVSP